MPSSFRFNRFRRNAGSLASSAPFKKWGIHVRFLRFLNFLPAIISRRPLLRWNQSFLNVKYGRRAHGLEGD